MPVTQRSCLLAMALLAATAGIAPAAAQQVSEVMAKAGAFGAWVDSARMMGSTTLELRVRYADQRWQEADGHMFDTVLQIGRDTLRTMSSTRVHDGQQFVANGQLRDGRPTPALARCRG